MARGAFIASVTLHSGLLALVCGFALRERTGVGPAESGLDWSAVSETAGELVTADSSELGETSESTEQLPQQQPANAPALAVSLTVAQTIAPMTMAGNFSAAIAPSIAAPPSFAPDGNGTATDTAPAAARKVSAKGGGARTRTGTGGGQAYTPARYASCPPPVFPAEARKARLSGTVLLLVQIDERGRPLSITLRQTSGHAILDTAALRAVRAWRFEPARRDGKPVDARLEIPIRFALS
jgi:protein TonB